MGSTRSRPKPRARVFSWLTSPNNLRTLSARSTQEFGRERLRAQASHRVALAASWAPHCPHNEYTRTPFGVTSRRMGRVSMMKKGRAADDATGGRPSAFHGRQARIRLINS